jgi:hypothetical protein
LAVEPWMWTFADAMKAAREQGVDKAGLEAMLQAFERASIDRIDTADLRDIVDRIRKAVGPKI